MAATSVRSFFNTFISLILLLFHLGCFIFTTTTDHHHRPPSSTNKKRKVTPLISPSNPSSPPSSSTRLKPHKSLSSSWSFIKRILSFKHHHHHPKRSESNNETDHQPSSPAATILASSQHSVIVTPADITILSPPPRKKRTGSFSDPDFSLIDQRSFPLRNDIFPCPTCGEIFQNPHLVEQHQSFKHAVTELLDGDSGKNIVQIIFKTGWNSNKDQTNSNPTIHRILKIHNSPKILARFEEYRELVKSKEAIKNGVRKRDERCIADGNELLRFHCSTFVCNLGQNGKSSICTQQYCSVCEIIRSGFSAKMDGISTVSSSWRAHVAFPEELEEEFAFMNLKRVMLICRVIAGRIGSEYQGMIMDKDEAAGFDSVIGGGGSGTHSRLDEEELLVFNPRAVLPCFAIIYSV